MNSAEEISKYTNHYSSPILARRIAGTSYDFPQKSPKKDKKWSIGNLFRRKKKESESSTEEENQKGFLQKKKKKSDKRKRTNKTIGFDHIVPPASRNGCKQHEDPVGVLSEPSVVHRNFIPASDFTAKLRDNESFSRSSLNRSNNSLGSPSIGSLGRRKKVVKARAEARRDHSKGEESSGDDDSQVSMFKSDESLTKQNKRSRSARTQRYLRRRSKDDELRDHLKSWKQEIEHDYSRNVQHFKLPDERMQNVKCTSKSPILSTSKSKLCYTNSAPPTRPNFSGLSTIPPSHSSHSKYRTISLTNGSSHKQSLYNDFIDTGNQNASTDFNNQRSLSCEANIYTNPSPDNAEEIVYVQFPICKPFNKRNAIVHQTRKQPPPPPPPRDPRRLLMAQNTDVRPVSYSFENGYKYKNMSDQHLNRPQETHRNFNSNCRSTSEDHISLEPSRVPLIPRPSSATPEAKQKSNEISNGYRYLTDKNPRSRKPICIQSNNNQNQKTFDFWRQKDEEMARLSTKKSSPIMFTAQTHVRTNIFPLPNGVKVETEREASPFRPITPKAEENSTRKSTNLEDALDELEAIYNSLHLGDEDLLDRAEQREAEAVQKRKDTFHESFPGSLSDSNYGRTRPIKKLEPDKKTDDMAFRKLNKERYHTISDPQSVVSKVSYLLSSPVFGGSLEDSGVSKGNSKEPDVTFDDVVYRNLKHTNNSLKVADPQPPFGIPVGPVLLAPNSDYLHATPESAPRYTFKPKKIPDIVKDDLAYRNLRKDPNKEPALPPSNFNPDDYINNNRVVMDGFKKKRAVRSMSANIFNLMPKDFKPNIVQITDDADPKQNITDVADALEIARQILREKEDKISNTRKAFMSDGELKYRKFESSSPTEQRQRFMNELNASNNTDNIYHHKLQVNIPVINFDRLETKPPTPDRRSSKPSTKESSPFEDAELKKQLEEASLDELLTSLAVEAREASDKITNDLNNLDEESLSKASFYSGKPDFKELVRLPTLRDDSVKIPEDHPRSEHAKLCEKLLECVIDSTDLLSATKTELEPSEEVAKISTEFQVANVVTIPSDEAKEEVVVTEVHSESDHDYVNLQSEDEKLKKSADESQQMVQETDSDEENELLIDDDVVSLDVCCMSSLEKNKIEGNHLAKNGGEGCFRVEFALSTNGCALPNETLSFNELNSEETEAVDSYAIRKSEEGAFDSLKSPKLVQNVNASYEIVSELLTNLEEHRDDDKAGGKKVNVSKEIVESNLPKTDCQLRDVGHTLEESQPSTAWYEDPSVVALACSFGVACTSQLPSFDIIAALGLIFAIISLLVALLTRT